jgi:prepilin-type N-terminal cleavage/methylation domain-containing protein
MTMERTHRVLRGRRDDRAPAHFRGFTIIELLVVVSIIALLVGILLPAIGRARDTARTSLSMSNLRNFGVAHETYSSEWGEKQFTISREDLGQYTTPCQYQQQTGEEHPWLWLGWSGTSSWGFAMNCSTPNNLPLAYPYHFPTRAGWFRFPNAKQFNQYVSGKFYDRVWWAPKDRIVHDTIDELGCFDDPGEFCLTPNGATYESSYCISPAGMYNKEVLGTPVQGGWQNPIGMPGSLRAPSAAQARYPDLKTRMLEHHWLQNARPNLCNPGISNPQYESNCEPWYFLHGSESTPMTLFYDGHVEGLGMSVVQADNSKHVSQAGYKLWCTSTPAGANGYFLEAAYDTGATESPHILTTEGIYGRDWFGE